MNFGYGADIIGWYLGGVWVRATLDPFSTWVTWVDVVL